MATTVDVIDTAGDSRISHQYTDLNGRKYHYLLGLPEGNNYIATVFLIHGWPDLSMGWRYQIPALLNLGLRVVCPDIMGFGQTEAPHVPPESMSLYGFKRAADDIRELAHQLNAPQIILGGHDWGGAVVYRVALWHPELVTHLFSVCTPYFPPSKTYLSTEQVVERLPNFTYQLQLSGPSVENSIRTKNRLRMFLRGLYGGLGPHGEMGFTVQEGVQLDKLELLGSSPLVSEKELDYYVDEYDHNGLHGPLNWYRTREVNYKDELQLTKRSIDIPVLFIVATKDAALPPSMSEGMEKYLPQLTRQSVDAGHWALWQAPEQVNRYIGGFLEEHGFGTKSTL